MPTLIKIILNWKLIKSFFDVLKQVFQEVIEKKIPPMEVLELFLDKIIELLRSGLIDIPKVDEVQLAKIIEELKLKIFPKIAGKAIK